MHSYLTVPQIISAGNAYLVALRRHVHMGGMDKQQRPINNVLSAIWRGEASMVYIVHPINKRFSLSVATYKMGSNRRTTSGKKSSSRLFWAFVVELLLRERAM